MTFDVVWPTGHRFRGFVTEADAKETVRQRCPNVIFDRWIGKKMRAWVDAAAQLSWDPRGVAAEVISREEETE